LKLSVIIVNFNVKYFLEQCLCSVTNACKNIEAEIIVVDNNSNDNSRFFFEGKFNDVTFIWNTINSGFSRANNLALKIATGEFVLFLNPDTILPEDCLESCLAHLQQYDDIGALGVRMVDGSGQYLKESKRGFPSPFTSFCKLLGLTSLFPSSRIFAHYYLGHLNQSKNHEVDVLSGAFMMIRKKVLDITGCFDEQYFMYGEDIDLSYSIQKVGYKNVYFAESTIIHFKGESTKKDDPAFIKQFYGAMGIFVKKHYSVTLAWLYNLFIQLIIKIKLSFFCIKKALQSSLPVKTKNMQKERCFIVSDKKDFASIHTILQKNNIGPIVIGRIEPTNLSNQDALGNLAELPVLIKREGVKELIFSINAISAKETITLIQLLPPDLQFRFHFTQTRAIIGSNNKESSGNYIA
jgi:GT2 family glycosyltransferase